MAGVVEIPEGGGLRGGTVDGGSVGEDDGRGAEEVELGGRGDGGEDGWNAVHGGRCRQGNHGGLGALPLRRKRGKHGPGCRVAPLSESAMSVAMRTAKNRPGEAVFLPVVGTEFNSFQEAKDFYNLYSWEVGFGIRKGRGRTNDNGYTTRQDIVCSCEGMCPNIMAASRRTGCKAMIRLHRSGDHGWYISRFEAMHNHPCSVSYGQNKQWPSHSDIEPMTMDVVTKLRQNNISIGRVCSILGVHGGESGMAVRKEAVRSLCSRIAQENIRDDIGKTMELLDEMKRGDMGMEVRFKLDDDGRIKSMLWCSGKNRADYLKFGDAVTFDTTYRTNLYNLPFGLFVGVNNHFQSIVFGGVLLTNEKVEDFEWAFSKFVEIMGGKAPCTILTDQCQAMAAAIKSTYPGSNHRWCHWHVLRKIKQKVGPVYSKKSKFKKEFNKLVTEETVVSRFERRWRQLMRKYNLDENDFIRRIYKHRDKWARPYFMGIFCGGMTSTQRSESANHMLKRFIQRSAPMHMFVRKFNEFQMDRNDEEEKEVYLMKQVCRKRRVGVPIKRHAEMIYTRRIYEKFYKELYYAGGYVIMSRTSGGVFEVGHSAYLGKPEQHVYKVDFSTGEKIVCQCGMFEHVGLLCRHALKVLVHMDAKEIPRMNIMARWLRSVDGGGEEGLQLAPGVSDVVKRRAIVNRVLEIAYGSAPISEDIYSALMGAMDRASFQGRGADVRSSGTGGCATACGVEATMEASPGGAKMKCPLRVVKKGRPQNSSLRSWMEEQKRKMCQSTDEDEVSVCKTRLIADVLARN